MTFILTIAVSYNLGDAHPHEVKAHLEQTARETLHTPLIPANSTAAVTATSYTVRQLIEG